MSVAIANPLPPRVAFVGSYVPRRCGIATFTHDLAEAVAGQVGHRPLGHGDLVTIAAVNDGENSYEYSPEVSLCLRQHRKEDYRSAAEFLNHSRAEVVSLQHEFGLFGGEDGAYLLQLVERLRKPLVTTLHTVLEHPSPGQRSVLEVVLDRAFAVVVMSERARELLLRNHGAPPEKVRMIHHGAPDVPFEDTEPHKARFGLRGRPLVLTFGLLNPDKGIEAMLDALGPLVPEFPDLAYLVLGITHPLVRKASGESYRLSLESRVLAHGIQRNVLFHNRYTSLEDLCDYLLATDIYVTPYTKREQIVSGTLAYAVTTGRAIISTPYHYAEELLAQGRGRLVSFGDVEGLSAALHELLAQPERRNALRRAAYDYGRGMVWKAVGGAYVELFEEARRRLGVESLEVHSGSEVIMRMSLPGVRLRHLSLMTDDTGLLQHSVYSTPDRRHGYTTDDNARALIAMAMMWGQFRDEEVLPHLQTYLSFLHHARTEATGRFHNFLSYDRHWLDKDGSDDCQGRAVWALGELTSAAPSESVHRLAERLFQEALQIIPSIRSMRGRSFCVLGLESHLRADPEDAACRERLEQIAESISREFARNASADWPWYEDVVTYDNARMPEALLTAGALLEREDLLEQGIEILRWLLEVQTNEEGWLSIIGNDGWMRRGRERARFDQQPLEAAAFVGACRAAHRATGETDWLVEMRRCFDWFLGKNDIGCAMIDFETHACHDGLTPTGPNANRGAESALAWLLSLLIMHEMHTGEVPEAGRRLAGREVGAGVG